MGHRETHVSEFPTIGKRANSPIRPQLFCTVDYTQKNNIFTGYRKHVYGIEIYLYYSKYKFTSQKNVYENWFPPNEMHNIEGFGFLG